LRARRSARPRSSSPSPRDRRARPIMPAASGPAMRRSAPTAIRARLPARTADAHPSVSQPGCRCSGSAATTSPRLPRLLQSASPPSGNFRRRLPPQPHAHEGPRNRVVQSSMLAPSPSQHLESQISRPGNPPGDSPKPNHALKADSSPLFVQMIVDVVEGVDLLVDELAVAPLDLADINRLDHVARCGIDADLAARAVERERFECRHRLVAVDLTLELGDHVI